MNLTDLATHLRDTRVELAADNDRADAIAALRRKIVRATAAATAAYRRSQDRVYVKGPLSYSNWRYYCAISRHMRAEYRVTALRAELHALQSIR